MCYNDYSLQKASKGGEIRGLFKPVNTLKFVMIATP